jgi:phage tail-like protein
MAAVPPLTTALRTDPIRNFKFRVGIDISTAEGGISIPNMGFASVSGISVQNELIVYREGGDNTSPRKMIGQSDHAPVNLSRGVFPNEEGLYSLQKHVFLWQWGQGTLRKGGQYRGTVTIESFDHPITLGEGPVTKSAPILKVKLYNAWCGSFAMNDWNAGDNGILIQQITLHHEGFEYLPLAA